MVCSFKLRCSSCISARFDATDRRIIKIATQALYRLFWYREKCLEKNSPSRSQGANKQTHNSCTESNFPQYCNCQHLEVQALSNLQIYRRNANNVWGGKNGFLYLKVSSNHQDIATKVTQMILIALKGISQLLTSLRLLSTNWCCIFSNIQATS